MTQRVMWAGSARGGDHQPVGEGDLDDAGRHGVVAGSEMLDVTSGQGIAPQRDPGRVDAAMLAHELERGLSVLALPAQIQQLAGVPVAVTPVAIVEGQHDQAGVGESFGEFVGNAHPADRAEASAEHDAGARPALGGK